MKLNLKKYGLIFVVIAMGFNQTVFVNATNSEEANIVDENALVNNSSSSIVEDTLLPEGEPSSTESEEVLPEAELPLVEESNQETNTEVNNEAVTEDSNTNVPSDEVTTEAPVESLPNENNSSTFNLYNSVGDDRAVTDVAIDATNFPDEQFRKYLTKFDIDGNGKFSQQELDGVTKIEIEDKSIIINDIKGIEYFSNLNRFGITNNSNLKNLDFSNNTKLEYIHLLEIITLDSIDVSNCPKLVTLMIQPEHNSKKTSISTLDVSNNKELRFLEVEGLNNLKSVVLKDNVKLDTIRFNLCDELETIIGVENLPSLQVFIVRDGKLSSPLHFTNSKVVQSIDISNQANPGDFVNTIDVSASSNLKSLHLINTGLTNFDLSKNLELIVIYLQNNINITELDLSNKPKLKRITVDNSPIKILDVSNKPELEYVSFQDTLVEELDCSNYPLVTGVLSGTKSAWINLNNNAATQLWGNLKIQELYRVIDSHTFNMNAVVNKNLDLTRVGNVQNATLDQASGTTVLNDITKPLVYEYDTYYPTHDGTNDTLKLTVNVYLNRRPEITASDVELFVGDVYDPLKGVSANDFEEGNLQFAYDSNVDVNTPGVYSVKYTVVDSKGAAAEKIIRVTVKERPVTPSEPQVKPVTPWDDGGPFTTDKCGNVFDRWNNLIWQSNGCAETTGYRLVNTSDN